MCGIAGIIGGNDVTLLGAMLGRIRHRGPDAIGCQQFADAVIGNVRLSIIDTSSDGNQPIADPARKKWVVMNGELYGYKKIRDHYQKQGYPFRSHTDTEILLPLHAQHGLNLFEHLNGMFTFSLYDQEEETILLARDHFGIKPLVYTVLNQVLYFASEVKALYPVPGWSPAPDHDAWHIFLNIRFPPSPLTLFHNVYKLPPGCYILLRKGQAGPAIPVRHEKISDLACGPWRGGIYRYYWLPERQTRLSFPHAVEQGESILQQAIDDQMVADVPVGVYLSGGIDSSTVTALASQNGTRTINTFCLGFNEPSDENQDANRVAWAFQTHHTDVVLDQNPLDQFRNAIYFMEEPKVNCLQGFILAKEAIKHQKVVLSGLGGDELFGGYDIYAIALVLDLLRRPPLCSMGKGAGDLLSTLCHISSKLTFDVYKRAGFLLRHLKSPLDLYLLLRNGWDQDQSLLKKIYAPRHWNCDRPTVADHFRSSFPESDSLAEAFMRFEFHNKMVDDFLANEDRMSMASSLESRVPFLDKNVVEFAFSLPVQWKISYKKRKILLKEILKKKLPPEILGKRKQGFTFNPVLQAKKDLLPLATAYLTRARVEESGVFQYDYIQTVLSARPHANLRWHYFLLWKILGYHLWEEIFIRNHGQPPADTAITRR